MIPLAQHLETHGKGGSSELLKATCGATPHVECRYPGRSQVLRLQMSAKSPVTQWNFGTAAAVRHLWSCVFDRRVSNSKLGLCKVRLDFHL